MNLSDWLSDNYIELFGAITGIIYVFLEIRQTIWLWPVGIITSAVYIWVFFTGKLYADMSLQGYYLIISCVGWYWWSKVAGLRAQGTGQGAQGKGENGDEKDEGEKGRRGDPTSLKLRRTKEGEKNELQVTRLKPGMGLVLVVVMLVLFVIMWIVLSRFTDSPVPGWDSFITSLSIVATWMLARKIYEHWFIWIVVNSAAAVLFLTRGLYPTVILYIVYGIMSFVGLVEWKKTIRDDLTELQNER